MLELQNLTKVYKTKSEEVVALNHLNLTFGEKGIVFVVGKSGSGKTTLLNVLGGLDSFDDGDLVIKGKSFRQFSQTDFDNYRNTFIGFVFQEYNLLDEMTVEKNIALAMELQGLKKDVDKINEILARVDLEGRNKRFPSELSGGQKQRVAIARALVKDPQIILTDEPTGALDTNSGIQVMNLLKELSKERLVIIVSHNMDLALAYGDRIIEMKDGDVVRDYSLARNEESKKLTIKEFDNKVIVRRGAKLSDKDVKVLSSAVEQAKDVEIVDEDNFYIETESAVEAKQYQPSDAKFIRGRLGFGNTMKLGLANFKIKPFRLVVTILLCAIAFSVFGMFDAMTINDDARLTANTLKNSNVPAVVLTTTYWEENGDERKFNLSQELVDELNEQTGMNFKGAFRLSSTRPDEVKTVPNISKYYRTNQLSGVIEIDGIDDLKYVFGPSTKMLAGRPPFNYDEIVLPWYYAMCVINYGYQGTNFVINDANCRTITPSDLVDESNPLVLTFNRIPYKIVGIIDTGEFDSKYDSLLDDYDGAPNSLKTDFENYVTNSFSLYGFVKTGFVENYYIENKSPFQYKNASYDFDFDVYDALGVEADKRPQYFFNYDQLSQIGNTVVFIDPAKTTLAANEVLLNIQLLEKLWSPSIEIVKEIAAGHTDKSYADDMEMLQTYLANVKTTQVTVEEKFESVREIVSMMTMLRYGIRMQDLTVQTKVTKRDTTKYDANGTDLVKVEVENDTYTVVGFYTGLAPSRDSSYVNSLVMTEAGMTNIGINVKQGSYSAVIAPSTKSGSEINKIVNLVTNDESNLDYTCTNNVLTIVTLNKDTLQEMSDLFLIVSGVFAVFAIVMMANYIATSITNRKTQIGILRALGTTGFGVLLMFLVQSLIIALFNIVLSNVATYFCCGFLNDFLEDKINVSIPLASYEIRQVLVISALSIGVAFLASLLPILNLSRKKPIDTIRR